MDQDQQPAAPRSIDDVLATAELARRPARAPDHAAENRAMAALARQLARDPRGVPQALAELVLELCGADSAGISVLEGEDGAPVFRWRAAAGIFAAHLDGGIAYADSPCAPVVERDTLLLLRHGARAFPALRHDPPMIENLLAPWRADGRAVGTVWAISHDPARRFDAEDARVLASLADFAAAAYHAIVALDESAAGRRELDEAAEQRARALAAHNTALEQEVAQRRQAEDALRASERRLRDLVDAMPAGVVACDADGTLLLHNGRAVELWGGEPLDRDWVLRGGWRAWTPDGYALEPQEAPLGAVLDGDDQVVDRELRIGRPDGSAIDILASARALRGQDGAIAGAIGVFQDITRRKCVEAALRASERRFRTLANAAPVLIWQNDGRGANVFVNQCFVDFTGRAAEHLKDGGWRAVVHPDDLQDYVDDYVRAARAHQPWRRQVRLLRRDGEWRWVDNHAEPLFAPDGAYCGHVGAALDITESVLAGQALQENDRRKDDFLAVLSHELRNPLAPISNAVHLLRHPGGRRRSDRIVEMLERQVRQIVRLVDDLLEISRITRDKIELERAPLPLAEAVHGALETSRPLIEAARHRLKVALPEQPLLLYADGVRLVQVLSNLLNNAARYTDPGGCIELCAWRDGDQAAIAVRDNGIGIPAAQLPHIFEIFTQAHRAAGRGQGGLGIGLAMVRSLVRLHGGSVEAHSAGPGQGSEFVVRLPLARDAEAGPGDGVAAAAGPAPLAGRRILVVDDNRDAADTLVMLLEADGARVEAAYDGAAALALLAVPAAPMPEAVLLDLGLPDMDGCEVARRIRATPHLAGMRIVALTGWGQQRDRERTHAAGFDLHLTKPVDMALLRAWLGQA